jgi:cytochrome c-type biogenesis protein CcmE
MAELLQPTQGIPSQLVRQKPANKNLKFIIGGTLILGLIVVLIVQATVATGAYFMTVSEVQAAGPDLIGKRVRVSGPVVENSEEWNAQEITLKFAIRDENGAQLPIVFYGPRPDNFARAASAIIEGQLQPDGTFKADTLLLKCPSRYEEEPEEVFVQSTR